MNDTSSGPPNDGKYLEEVVTKLERILANQGLQIESRKRLRDRDTGELREFDVVLTGYQGHHQLIVGIEVRDRSRPVGVEQIEGFSTKCQKCGLNQGVIVASGGFASTARLKAEKLGIRCLDLVSVDTLDWLLGKEIMVSSFTVPHGVNMVCIPVEQSAEKPTDFEILDDKDTPVSNQQLLNEVNKHLHHFHSLPPGIHRRGIIFATPGYKIRDLSTQQVHGLLQIQATFDVAVSLTPAPFKLFSYQEVGVPSEIITNAAFASIDMGDVSGDLVMSQKPGEGTKIDFIIKTPPKKAPQEPPTTIFKAEPSKLPPLA